MAAPSVRKKKSFALRSDPSVRMSPREPRDLLTMASQEVCWPVPMRAIGAQNLLTMPGGVSTSGYLHKKGGSQFSLLKWPLRYIILHKGCVYYFKTSTSASPQGAFSLNGYNRVMRAAEETTSSNVFPFKIIHFSKKHRTWFFSAASEDERRKWMRHLRKEIDHYNDRRDSHISSDSDSDAESFYGSIERPMDIRHTADEPDHDYMDDEEDEDDEDYLKPDDDLSPTSTGRATVPPPSYPPPPVPCSMQRRLDPSPSFSKLAPPPIPTASKPTTSPLTRKPPPPCPLPPVPRDPSNKGLPPPLPFAPHLPKPHTPSVGPSPPLLPPPNLKKLLQGRGSVAPEPGPRCPLPTPAPASLPVCSQLQSTLVLNGPDNQSEAPAANGAGGHSPSVNSHRAVALGNKPDIPLPLPPNSRASSHAFTCPALPGMTDGPVRMHTPPSHAPPLCPSPRLPHPLPPARPALPSRPIVPKPPPPKAKTPPPTTRPKHRGPSLQRESPDGQSFRSSVEEMPTACKKKKDPNRPQTEDDDSDDYENVQLPSSVFVETTETSSVEKLFKEVTRVPKDGLYCIRKSGTKTSKVLVVWDVSLGKARNYRLFEEDSRVFLDSECTFPSLAALVEYYYCSPLPNHGSLCLQQPFGYQPPS